MKLHRKREKKIPQRNQNSKKILINIFHSFFFPKRKKTSLQVNLMLGKKLFYVEL